MSQWTHVNGAIRYDALRIEGMPFNTLESYKELLGNTASFDDDEKAWDKCNVPSGSEGSIQFNFWKNPDLHHIAAFGVHIFGDLRDFGDDELVERIKKWFEKVTTAKNVIVRSAILEIAVEGSEPIILQHKSE
jgi:hypothetical protein